MTLLLLGILGEGETSVVANAGANILRTHGTPFNRTGSATVVNGEGDTTYNWARVSGELVNIQLFSSNRTVRIEPVASVRTGTTTMRFTATNNGVSDTDDFVITWDISDLPVAHAPEVEFETNPPSTMTVGTQFSLVAVIDDSGTYDTLSYSWTGARGIQLNSGNGTTTAMFTAIEAGVPNNGLVSVIVVARGTGTIAQAGSADTDFESAGIVVT